MCVCATALDELDLMEGGFVSRVIVPQPASGTPPDQPALVESPSFGQQLSVDDVEPPTSPEKPEALVQQFLRPDEQEQQQPVPEVVSSGERAIAGHIMARRASAAGLRVSLGRETRHLRD